MKLSDGCVAKTVGGSHQKTARTNNKNRQREIASVEENDDFNLLESIKIYRDSFNELDAQSGIYEHTVKTGLYFFKKLLETPVSAELVGEILSMLVQLEEIGSHTSKRVDNSVKRLEDHYSEESSESSCSNSSYISNDH